MATANERVAGGRTTAPERRGPKLTHRQYLVSGLIHAGGLGQ
ncbi:hypothetical protein AAHZ94_28755 [Streptomyces sp. HSW2009]